MRRTWPWLVSLLMSTVPVVAQEPSSGTVMLMPPQQSGSGVVFSGPGGEVGVISLGPVDAGRPVLDAPYSADAVTEITQTLEDGNQIEQRTFATVARDSRGRTRREQRSIAVGSVVAHGASSSVTITDPVTRTYTTLNRDQKIAFRAPAFALPNPPLGASGATGGFVGGMSGAVTADSSHEVRTQPLAAKEIEGIRVEGTRTTMTIPAGALGNKRPIEVVSERWYSPELQVVIETRRSDPRFGQTLYRLKNIVRAEPPAHLFQVPADFRIVEAPSPKS